MPGPLDGIRVIDFSTVVMGPYATQLLGDWGAEVIKVEDRVPDTSRYMGPGPVPGLSGVALNLLRNKRSIVVDLKTADGLAVAKELVRSADVVVTNLRPGPLRRLGLTYEDLRADDPRLIFCHAQGWSKESGWADRPAYDDVIQASSGAAFLQERVTGQPALMPTLVADKVCGLMICNAVLAAVVARHTTGLGQRVEVPMFDTTLSFLLVEHLAAAAVPGGSAGYPRILTRNRRAHPTTDGWIVVLPYSNAHWRTICRFAERNDLEADERFSSPARRITNADALYEILGALLATRSTVEWSELCESFDIPFAVVHDLDAIVTDPGLHRGVLVDDEHPVAGPYRRIASPVRFSETPADSHVRPAPLAGADTDEILRSLGRSDDAIAELRANGAVQ